MVKILSLSLLIAILTALSSCSKADKATSGRIAAKVNGDQISVQQVHDAMLRSGAVLPVQADQVAVQVLERIIDEELLLQKALETKLDRDPNVVRAIENARRQILGQAYVAKAVGVAPMVPADAIGTFYRQNPALFERRRIYRIQELEVGVAWEQIGALQAVAAGSATLYEVAAWLKSQNIAFNFATATRPAEQLSIDQLRRVSQMQDGQIAAVPARDGVAVIQLVQSRDAPVSEQQAAPIIERFLSNLKRVELATAEVTALRQKARIEYLGDFKTAEPDAPRGPSADRHRAADGEDPGYVDKLLYVLR
jgi:EpsD family peptidyl-prolyl cis-trans isomerase